MDKTSNAGTITTIVIIVLVIIGVVVYMKSDNNTMKDNNTVKDNTMMNNNDKMMTTDDSKKMTVTEDGVMVGGAMMVKSKDIVDNAINATNVTTLVAAVKAAGLVETLKGAGPFTVFAPTNAAFAKLPAKTVETLLKPENKVTLVKILTYHVVAGRYTAADLKDGMTLKSVEGENLMIKKDTSGKITINGTAMVETTDVISSNGVTFVIDTVLMPKIK